jgi:Glycosyl hydrolases family 43
MSRGVHPVGCGPRRQPGMASVAMKVCITSTSRTKTGMVRSVNFSVGGIGSSNSQYHFPFKGNWKIGIASAPTPAGPFVDIGAPIEGIRGIDPKLFIDDDKQVYLYFNSAAVVRLKDNMMEIAEQPRQVDYGSSGLADDKFRFEEGSFMHKRNGVYVYSYSNWANRDTTSYYATGTRVLLLSLLSLLMIAFYRLPSCRFPALLIVLCHAQLAPLLCFDLFLTIVWLYSYRIITLWSLQMAGCLGGQEERGARPSFHY